MDTWCVRTKVQNLKLCCAEVSIFEWNDIVWYRVDVSMHGADNELEFKKEGEEA